MIRAAKNGCSSEITFKGKKVYHDWDYGIKFSSLGEKLNKDEWIINNVNDESKIGDVQKMFVDWQLYENGWYVQYGDGYKNEHLFYYLQQMRGYGRIRPKELEYLG